MFIFVKWNSLVTKECYNLSAQQRPKHPVTQLSLMGLQRPKTSRIWKNNSWILLTLYQSDKCSCTPHKNLRPNSSANNYVINHNHNIFTLGTQYSHIFTSVFTLYFTHTFCCINYKCILIFSITQNTLLYNRILLAD